MDEPTLFLLYFMCTLIGVGLVALLVLFCMVLYHEPEARKVCVRLLALAGVILAVSTALYVNHPIRFTFNPHALWVWLGYHWSAVWLTSAIAGALFFIWRNDEIRDAVAGALCFLGVMAGSLGFLAVTIGSVIDLLAKYGVIK